MFLLMPWQVLTHAGKLHEMKVVTNEDDLLVTEVIRRHLIEVEGGAVVVKAEKFYSTGLNFDRVANILDKLRDASLLDDFYHAWGKLNKRKGSKWWRFTETSRDDAIYDDDPMQGEAEFFSITLNTKYPSTDALIEGVKSLTKKISATGEVDFSAQQKTLRYGDIIYSFQKARADHKRFLLIKELWESRSLIGGGRAKRKGEKLPIETVAVRIGLIESAQIYFHKYNKENREKMRQLVKNINTDLRRKSIPMKIKLEGGIQIVVSI